jgi:hypothetical protein
MSHIAMTPLTVTVTQLVHRDSEEVIPVEEEESAERNNSASLTDNSTVGHVSHSEKSAWNAV